MSDEWKPARNLTEAYEGQGDFNFHTGEPVHDEPGPHPTPHPMGGPYLTIGGETRGSWSGPEMDIQNIPRDSMPPIWSGPITAPPGYEVGQKHDQNKPRVELLDADALEGVAKVLAFGAKKYAAHNWRGGIVWSRLLGGLLRHAFAIMRGEYTDSESGLPHIDHLGCCWMFLSNHMKNRHDLNDLWKGGL